MIVGDNKGLIRGGPDGDIIYELRVPTCLQTVRAVAGFLDCANRHCADPDEFVSVRLSDDMSPFHFQIEAAWHHAGRDLDLQIGPRRPGFTSETLILSFSLPDHSRAVTA